MLLLRFDEQLSGWHSLGDLAAAARAFAKVRRSKICNPFMNWSIFELKPGYYFGNYGTSKFPLQAFPAACMCHISVRHVQGLFHLSNLIECKLLFDHFARVTQSRQIHLPQSSSTCSILLKMVLTLASQGLGKDISFLISQNILFNCITNI